MRVCVFTWLVFHRSPVLTGGAMCALLTHTHTLVIYHHGQAVVPAGTAATGALLTQIRLQSSPHKLLLHSSTRDLLHQLIQRAYLSQAHTHRINLRIRIIEQITETQ